MQINEIYDDLRAAGVNVIAVTSCPGDNKKKIEEKENLLDASSQIKFEVLSKPFSDEGYNIAGLGDFWTTKYQPNFEGGYNMVQPAVVVLDANSSLVPECMWSWKTMGKADGKVYENEMEPYGTGMVVVTARPVIADLLPSIQEKRPVKIAAAMT